MKWMGVCLLLAATALPAQDIKMPASIEALARKASESVEVNLDGTMLRFASKFMDPDDADEAKALNVVKSLRGIVVRSYTFDKKGEYSMSDVQQIRSQLEGPGWTPLVKVRSKKAEGNADIFLRMVNDKVTGLFILSAEPKELTVVGIDGTIDPNDIEVLGGQFGIPKMKDKDRGSAKAGKSGGSAGGKQEE
jgi:hypothetical protein